jgi:VanZ family protein
LVVSRYSVGLLLARIGLVVWIGLIFWSSLAPADQIAVSARVSDKLLHAVGYALLGALAVLSFRRPRPVPILIGIVAFGLLLEILQRRTGYRSFEWTDLLADALGAVIGITAALIARDAHARRA